MHPLVDPVRGSGNRASRKVVIVGAGAAGTLTAAHLLREQPDAHLEIELIDQAGEFGPGVAYGTSDDLHRLNVPTVRMGGISGQPEHFYDWLREREPNAAENGFMSRRVYGEYLRELLLRAESEAPAGSIGRRTGEVLAVGKSSDNEGIGGGLTLTLDERTRVGADQVVLALGSLGPGDPIPVPDELLDSGVYVRDPWAQGALDALRDKRDVLIVGTGLTMVDVALSLCERGAARRVRAVSRHGLVPRRHRRDLTRIRRFSIPIESGDLAPVMAAILGQIGRVAQQGDDWRDVIDSMRPSTPKIWKSLRTEEKRRFLTDLQRFWDVHRFRMAPDVADRLEAMEAAQRVSFSAGSIVSLEARGGGVRAFLRRPGSQDLEPVDADAIVNCAGVGADLRREPPPLLRSLLDAGLARLDELGLGLDVTDDGALIDAAGLPSKKIHVVGALRKGVEWEAIGITEIRDQAAAVAAGIAAAEGITVPSPTLEAAA
jgi:uncharacterized NAD(P)/FAD-binding protein YdhS